MSPWRKAKNKYTWHGIARMPAALERLWKEAGAYTRSLFSST